MAQSGALAAPAGKAVIAQKTCPVMGGPIDPGVYTDHEGRRVYFCCPGCIDTFKQEPEAYLAKIDAGTAAGS
jgi:YHS domain-containing protein